MADRTRPLARLAQVLAAGALAAGGAWAVGVDAGHVVALGLLCAGVVGVVGLMPATWPLLWPDEEPSTSGSGWHQVALLSGYLRQVDLDPDRVGSVVTRMRSLAVSRLARAGTGWHSADARALLGEELYDVLDGRRPPPAATTLVTRTLDRLHVLDESPGRGTPDAQR